MTDKQKPDSRIIKFSLRYCGVEESDEMDCTGMTEKEIEKELVNALKHPFDPLV